MNKFLLQLVTTGACCFALGLFFGTKLVSKEPHPTPRQSNLSSLSTAPNLKGPPNTLSASGATGVLASDANADTNPRVPISKLVRAYGSPLGTDLIPKSNLRSLGFNEVEFKTIQDAFQQFKDDLERYEKQNAQLKTGPDGDFYEIKPFELAGDELKMLRDKIATVTGPEDWRADFLVESLKASSDAAGLGKYRQEVALEQHVLGGKSTYGVMSRVFDMAGRQIDGSGYQVRSMEEIKRYASLFSNK